MEKKIRNNKGFSLVELIIVIAIMAVLAGIIGPAIIRYIDKARAARAMDEARVIVNAVETAIATKAGEDAELHYNNSFTDSSGRTRAVGLVTNWMLGEVQSGTVFNDSSIEYSNYLITVEVLENLQSSARNTFKFFNFTGSNTSAIGMNCSTFAARYSNCPGVIIAYDETGKVVMLEYYNYGCLIHYEDGKYTHYEDVDEFISANRLR